MYALDCGHAGWDHTISGYHIVSVYLRQCSFACVYWSPHTLIWVPFENDTTSRSEVNSSKNCERLEFGDRYMLTIVNLVSIHCVRTITCSNELYVSLFCLNVDLQIMATPTPLFSKRGLWIATQSEGRIWSRICVFSEVWNWFIKFEILINHQLN